MINQDLLDILRCPNCVKDSDGELIFFKECWLLCEACERKYPIIDDIPVMLLDEGEKWISTKKEDLPIPPPEPQ